jgi:hypothetical protein
VLVWKDRPIFVYVCDEAGGCEAQDKLDNLILKDEKVALGAKAFRTVKMHPDLANEDPVLKGHGKEVPRMLFVNPTDLKVTVLEGSKLKTSTLSDAMEKAAGSFWKEKLDKVVTAHLKLLTEQDQLANAQKVLAEKKTRLSSEDGAKAKKELEELAKEEAELQKEIRELDEKEAELWKLTPKPVKGA